MKIIDITMWMGDWTYPGDKSFTLNGPYSAIGPDKEFCYSFTSASVDGTHIQAPHYVLKSGKSINDFDISYFRREAVLVDFLNLKGNIIPGADLRNQLGKEKLKDKAVIFRTGIMDQLIKGKAVKDKLLLPPDTKYLIDRGIKMIVTDTTCLDDPTVTGEVCASTELCCQSDVLLVKQVCNLDKVTQKHVTVEAYPLKIRKISGTPCRVVIIE